MQKHQGDNWHKFPWRIGNLTLGDLALTPSKIYTSAVVDMFGGYCNEPKTEIHGAVNITGGGIPEKLGRVLKPSGLGAVIDEPFKPSEFILYTQALGSVSDREAYKTWNMGQGMIIITPKPEDVIRISREHGITAQYIGKIVNEQGIRIRNKGAYNPEDSKELIF